MKKTVPLQKKQMAGIYIHIPFCKQRCVYCGFYSTVARQVPDAYIKSLQKELLIRKHYLSDATVETIYFGGGTPSMLSIEQINTIINTIKELFPLSLSLEITLEANPEQLNLDYLNDLYSQTPVNRLSIGVQSLNESALKWLNRRHKAQQAIDAVCNAGRIGFYNLSIDLIYGLPCMTMEQWTQTLSLALQLPIRHLSAYSITVEENTILSRWIRKGKEHIDEDLAILQYHEMQHQLHQHAFEPYEISNYAQKGFQSRHNSSYWKGEPYLGIGASAHSYNGVSRQWNPDSVITYLDGIEKNNPYITCETITPKMAYNEYIMLSLRTTEGIQLQQLNHLSEKLTQKQSLQENKIKTWIDRGLLMQCKGYLRLTDKGKLFADAIASEMFI